MNISSAANIVRSFIQHNLALPEGSSDASYLVPMMWSLPGEGKTTSINALGEELGCDVRTVIIAQFDAGELGGFPVVDREKEMYVRYAPFFMKEFPADRPTILFLDEIAQSNTSQLNICAQLVNERRIGEHRLPANVSIVCAGNPMSARAGTTQLPTHLKSRMTHLEIEADHEAFREFALEKSFLPEVTGFINERPEFLQKFDPNQNACPSPRSWERVNSILGLGLPRSLLRDAIKGQIGEAAVTDFFGYMTMFQDLPSVEDEIFVDPENARLPGAESPDVLYALCSNLAHKTKEENTEALVTYLRRFTAKEFAAFCVRDLLSRNPSMKKDRNIAGWVVSEGRDLLL